MKKKLLLVLMCVIISLCTFILFGCKSSYTVRFNSDGGSLVYSQTVEKGGKVSEPNFPIKSGYTFDGWYYNDELWSFDNPVTQGIELVAKWTANIYTVTFDSDGGSAVESGIATYDQEFVLPSAPTKSGYTFDGWYNGTRRFNGGKYKQNRDLFLKAKWVANTYTVTFDSDGGSAVEDKLATYDQEFILPSEPTKTGYNFDGWYNGNDKYNGGKWNSLEGLSLTAKWLPKQYTVSFWIEDEKATENKVAVYNEEFVLPNLQKDGYSLSWYYGNDKIQDVNQWKINEDDLSIEIRGEWTANTYTVSFDSDGGSAVEDKLATYDQEFVLPSEPTKTGYNFDGWYNGNDKYDGGKWNGLEGLTLTAKWLPKQYTVEFTGFLINGIPSTVVNYGEEVTLPTVGYGSIAIGYDFNHWEYQGNIIRSGDTWHIDESDLMITLRANCSTKPEMVYFNFTSTTTTCKITGLLSETVTDIIIPQYVTEIADRAFYNCDNLESVIICGGRIGNEAFYGCNYITTVEICEGITDIGDSVFVACSRLVNISIPNSVENLTHNFLPSNDDINYYSYQGFLYLGNETNHYVYLAGVDDYSKSKYGNITIHSDCRIIGAYALGTLGVSAGGGATIQIPTNVVCIGRSAINTVQPAKIVVPDTVKYVGRGAFTSNTALGTRVFILSTSYPSHWGSEWLSSNYNYYLYSETDPGIADTYWHYVDGEIVIWE